MCKFMGKLPFLCLVFLVHQSTPTKVIYRLSPKDYARMPNKNHLDHYTRCLIEPGGVYCTAYADVVSDGPSELLDMMRGYSAFSLMHYNYTQLRYGLCMKKTCREFYNGSSEPELRVAAEACLNKTLSSEYGLKTRVAKMNCYFEDDTKNMYTVDWVDWAVAALLFTIFALNVLGSVYDFSRDQTKPGNKFLLSFSCRLNWKQLMAPPSPDPRATALQSFNGVRFLTSAIVVLVHAPMTVNAALGNLDFLEKSYTTTDYYIMYNAGSSVQSFFLLSGFLLAYNMQISAEKQPFTWKKYFKSIFLRYLRLAPMTIIALMLTATWMRFFGYGPLWQEQTGEEVTDCRNHWIYNVLFLNNFVTFSSCHLEAWSTATDFHLHTIGLTVILLAPSAAWRRAALAALGVVGLAWPAYSVITMDLDGTLLPSPEPVSLFYMKYDTFHYLYKPTNCNIPVFIIGMTFGYIVYDLQKKATTQDCKKYRYAYWCLVPVMYVLLYIGGYFFTEGPRTALLFRVLYASFLKPLYGLTVMLVIFGAINKVETLYRGILEWQGFVPLGKLSFCIYTFHMLVIRHLAGTRSTLFHYSPWHGVHDYLGILSLCIIVALVMYLAVEAPLMHLVKLAFAPRPPAPPAVTAKETKTE